MRWTILAGMLLALAMLVTAMWGWQSAASLVESWRRPDVGGHGVRCAAVALAAGAQLVLFGLVIQPIYRRAPLDVVFEALAGAVCTVAIVSAVALALVGR